MRPCTCDNAVIGDMTPNCCVPCWKWLNSADWRAYWSTGKTPRAKPRKVSLPCIHLGDPLTGHEREALGLDHRRNWRRCELGVQLKDAPAGIVCGCVGCGPKCLKYESAGG